MARNGSTSQTRFTSSSKHTRKQGTNGRYSPSSPGSTKDHEGEGHSLDLDEDSPLLSPVRSQGDRAFEGHDTPTELLDWSDGQQEQSKSVFYLFILTLSIGG